MKWQVTITLDVDWDENKLFWSIQKALKSSHIPFSYIKCTIACPECNFTDTFKGLHESYLCMQYGRVFEDE